MKWSKLRSVQSPLAVAMGFEKEHHNPYLYNDHTNKLYKEVEGGFVEVKVKGFEELLQESQQRLEVSDE